MRISVSFARQVSLNFAVSALFDIIFHLTPLKKFVSLVLSGIDYCNSLLAGLPLSLISKLQKDTKLRNPSCSSCILKCTHHTSSQAAPLVTRQNSHFFLQNCLPLFQRHQLLFSCLFFWSLASVFSLPISSLQCWHLPPKTPTLSMQDERWSCLILFWPFCLELIATSHQKCYDYRYF